MTVKEVNGRRRRKRRGKGGTILRSGLAMVCMAVFLTGIGEKNRMDGGTRKAVVPSVEDSEDSENSEILAAPTVSKRTEEAAALTEQTLTAAEKLAVIQTSAAYPEDMVVFAQKYEQVIDYVYDYPELKDSHTEIDLTLEASSDTVPLLLQWDARWGYVPYGSGLIGYTGCGPVCLSMAALYLTGDPQWTPLEVATFAETNGYCVPGDGTSWTLISEGSASLGLCATELPLSESVMKQELDRDHPIIAVVGPGDFTYTGHYLVITGYDADGFHLNDPNSRENSERVWDYDTLSPQIRNLWAMSAA